LDWFKLPSLQKWRSGELTRLLLNRPELNRVA
jgi:hypothetical protein